MYKKLEDWIFVAQKAEMDAIDQVSNLIKQHIESEKKIKSELRIRFMDFTVDHQVLNYITPPPPLLAAIEDRRDDRFNIDQLNLLREEFETMEASQMTRERFRDKSVVDMFISKKNLSFSLGGFWRALPADWSKYGQEQIRQMVINLDIEQSGYINWRHMFTYFALLKSSIPSTEQIVQLRSSLPSNPALADFLKGSFWFDKTESSVDRPDSHVFDRARMIKEMLFKVHSKLVADNAEPVVEIENLCQVFTSPLAKHPKAKFANYSEYLFAPINKTKI